MFLGRPSIRGILLSSGANSSSSLVFQRWSCSTNTAVSATNVSDDQQSVVPLPPKELRFFETFLQQEKDYHLTMLAEAHRKHGVNMFVPPQLPPNGSPPEVPDVIFGEAQTERLRSITLAYAPTHGPPPLETTGNRGLPDDQLHPFVAKAAVNPLSTSAGKPAAASSSSTKVRLPIEEDKKFHCSACGKPFRVLLSAEHHARTAHVGEQEPASVQAGPGPGELVVKEEPVEAAASSAAATVASTRETTLQKVSDKKLAVLTLPTSEEVDALLTEVWDPFGLGKNPKFVTASSVVLGIADDRKPFSEEDLKPSARATPAGAAPGIKKTFLASATPAAARAFKSIKELSARFPSPFGDSVHAHELAALENEPKNPFLNLPEAPLDQAAVLEKLRTGPGAPSLMNAATSRRFKCPTCSKAFRLLDALIDHHEEVHGESMSDTVLADFRNLEKRNVLCKPKEEKTASLANDADGKKSPGAEERATSDVPPTPVVEADVGVHFRAHSNAILQGQVTEIQRGFLKTAGVTQLVIKAVGDITDGEAAAADEELIVVRCFGDAFAQSIGEQVKVGMTVLANGSLRMNRRLDAVSKRTHAYPYIAVSPPLGSVHVVDG